MEEERHKLFLDVQRERMEFDRERALESMAIERERMDMEKQERLLKMDLEKTKIFETIEIEKERVRLAEIMLQDTSLMDDESNN